MAQATAFSNSTTSPSGVNVSAAATSSTSSSSSNALLYPILESATAPLEESEKNTTIFRLEKELVSCLRDLMPNGNLLEDIEDKSILPTELFSTAKKVFKPRLDPLKRLKELPSEEVDEEEEQEDEEEDEEQEVVEDEEDDAGGDYLISHFDNGENYEDNDEEGDDVSGMM